MRTALAARNFAIPYISYSSRNTCSQFPPYLGTVVGGRKGVEIVPVGGIDSRSADKEQLWPPGEEAGGRGSA